MAPLIAQVAGLVKRADGCVLYGIPLQTPLANKILSCGSGQYRAYDGYCYSRSTWHWWGRWVFAGLSILFILIVMAILM
ncbi:hypothetical protein BT67DRAFT_439319 [Trichocladium antarcticum]|uniref:Uncharacterized protein n=1 Tax=Trichocladium antarcticum TaxID=1450529 RepID=A0AAN6UP67_9PEZI|nr:hypothetical protein BT67DRAFT_439319 [Trichocladium antarcticum]